MCIGFASCVVLILEPDINDLNDKESGGSFSSAMLFTSLYLVLLSFFILLNSFSERDFIKTEEGIKSIANVFSGGGNQARIIPDSPELFNFDAIINSYYQKTRKLVRQDVQLFDVTIDRVGNMVSLSFPTNSFFKRNNTVINRKYKVFMGRLIKIFTSNSRRVKTTLSVSISSDTYLKYDPEQSYKLDVRRAGAIVNRLISGGMQRENISAGIRPDKDEKVVFEFSFIESE